MERLLGDRARPGSARVKALLDSALLRGRLVMGGSASAATNRERTSDEQARRQGRFRSLLAPASAPLTLRPVDLQGLPQSVIDFSSQHSLPRAAAAAAAEAGRDRRVSLHREPFSSHSPALAPIRNSSARRRVHLEFHRHAQRSQGPQQQQQPGLGSPGGHELPPAAAEPLSNPAQHCWATMEPPLLPPSRPAAPAPLERLLGWPDDAGWFDEDAGAAGLIAIGGGEDGPLSPVPPVIKEHREAAPASRSSHHQAPVDVRGVVLDAAAAPPPDGRQAAGTPTACGARAGRSTSTTTTTTTTTTNASSKEAVQRRANPCTGGGAARSRGCPWPWRRG